MSDDEIHWFIGHGASSFRDRSLRALVLPPKWHIRRRIAKLEALGRALHSSGASVITK
jgi:hypothetical protein